MSSTGGGRNSTIFRQVLNVASPAARLALRCVATNVKFFWAEQEREVLIGRPAGTLSIVEQLVSPSAQG
jgi:carboxylesterase type B